MDDPDICICEPDEPSYRVDPRQLRTLYPEMWERSLWQREVRYLDSFRPGGDARILGEASTNYTMLPLLWGPRKGSPRSIAPAAATLNLLSTSALGSFQSVMVAALQRFS
jgi:hypothetical protein